MDERQHAERRRILNSLYLMSNIIQLEDSVDKCVNVLVQRFTECAARGNSINMSEWVQWCVRDIIDPHDIDTNLAILGMPLTLSVSCSSAVCLAS
jgi:hypothetical protein